MKKLLNALLALIFCLNIASLFASPFSEDVIEPVKEKADAAAEATKDFFKDKLANLKAKTAKTFATITGKINKVAKKDLKSDDIISHRVFIPGHENKNFVCQGITYLPEKIESDPMKQIDNRTYKIALLSYYPKTSYTKQPTQLVAVDMFKNTPIARFALYSKEGQPYKGHAGGITLAGKYLWVASGFKLYAFSLSAIIDFVNKAQKPANIADFSPVSLQLPACELVAVAAFPVDAKASFVSFDGKYIWVGDFARSGNKDYAPVAHHLKNPWKKSTWISGYKVDNSGFPTSRKKYSFKDGDSTRKVYQADRVICCRESVQGMAVFNEHVALSISYGAQNSKLAVYRSPLAGKGKKLQIANDYEVEAFVLGEKEGNWLKTYFLPAGSEDLEFDGRYLYVTFEGSSKNYRQKWINTNPRINISEDFYLLNPGRIVKE
jgi:hypothetical protein